MLDYALGEKQHGLETLRRLRELYPEQRAIVVSGHTPVNVEGALPDGWLTKPYGAEELALAVGNALGLERVPSAERACFADG